MQPIQKISVEFFPKSSASEQEAKEAEPTKFHPDEEERTAVDELKENLINHPILPLPRDDKRLVIETNACGKQVGCVPLEPQQDEQDTRPIGYWSCSLSDAKWRCDMTQRECLEVV